MEILFTLWKDRNVVLLTHNFLYINIAMYTKACICDNVMMQIQVQANKAALEVAYLQDLPHDWCNASCVINRLPPDASVNTTPPRGHNLGHYSLGYPSHMLHLQDSRHLSPKGGDCGWD